MVLIFGLSYTLRRVVAFFSVVLAGYYVHTFVRRQSLGLPRVLAALPLLPFHLLLPYFFDPFQSECCTIFVLTGCVIWLGTFRIAAFCWDQGHAAPKEFANDFAAFFPAVYFPIRAEPQSERQILFVWNSPFTKALTKFLLRMLVIYVAFCVEDIIPDSLTYGYLAFGLGIMQALSAMTDCFEFIAYLLAPNLKITPAFGNIFMATSYRDIWGKYWNLVITDCLRDSVFIPVVYVTTPFFEKLGWTAPEGSTRPVNGSSAAPQEVKEGSPGKEGTAVVTSNGAVREESHNPRRRLPAEAAASDAATTAEAAQPPARAMTLARPRSKNFPWAKVPPPGALGLGLMASFSVSGIMHQVNVWYRCHIWFMPAFWFFFLNGALCCLEEVLKAVLGISFRKLPQPWGRLLLNVCFLAMITSWVIPLGLALPNNDIMFNEVRVAFGFEPVDMQKFLVKVNQMWFHRGWVMDMFRTHVQAQQMSKWWFR